jgi:hypothetical protein
VAPVAGELGGISGDRAWRGPCSEDLCHCGPGRSRDQDIVDAEKGDAMGKKPTSTRRERAKRVVRDLSSRATKASETRGGTEKLVIVYETMDNEAPSKPAATLKRL